ncbi:MAG: PQQ-binding-like beta-propeller repeat protein, partial [Thioalkalivibrio sp.]|nr:PQQ-binding-like beta-propeller repeat protein [Thioalkalivibrio sp.]
MSVPVPTMTVLRLLVTSGLIMALSACGLWSRDTTEPPAELTEFEAEGQPESVWSRSIGTGADRFLWRVEPAVSGERVVVSDARGQVSALDPDDGSRRWQIRLEDARVSAGVGLAEAVAVVGTLDG